MIIETGGPAFPSNELHSDGSLYQQLHGMTMRDYFAAKSLPGLISGRSWDHMKGGDVITAWAEASYAVADAMLEARKS